MKVGRSSSPFLEGGRVNILGVKFDPVSMSTAADRVMGWAEQGSGISKTVFVSGVHGVMEARENPEFRATLNSADLNVPDGMPAVWLGKHAGFASMGRVFGPDLMHEVMKRSAEKRMSHFFYGGKEGVARDLAAVMTTAYPGTQVSGTYTPPFRSLNPPELKEVVERINASPPHFLWVGLSTPKQETWVHEMKSLLKARVIVAVGAAFDYNTGRLKRAPRWMQEAGLEWLFRLAQEPRRLARRYLVNNPKFVAIALLQFLRVRDFSTITK